MLNRRGRFSAFVMKLISCKRRRSAGLMATSVLLIAELSCTSTTSPTSPEFQSSDLRDMVPEMWSRSRNGAQARLARWFDPEPVPLGSDRLTVDQLLASLTFRDEEKTGHPFCWYGSGVVHVSVAERRSGCFEHELGHAALHLSGYANWRCFEHPEKDCH